VFSFPAHRQGAQAVRRENVFQFILMRYRVKPFTLSQVLQLRGNLLWCKVLLSPYFQNLITHPFDDMGIPTIEEMNINFGGAITMAGI
jgi:hypothetical protein